jgi:hypothetical protein
MVSAMILLLGSQVQMYAQKKGGPDHKRPGMEMRDGRRPGGPMDGKAISQGDIKRLQDFYWREYRVKISKKEAEKILIAEMRDRGRDGRDFGHYPPPPPRGPQKPDPRGPKGPDPKGPQGPPPRK